MITDAGQEIPAAFAAGILPARLSGVAYPAASLEVPLWLTPLSATLVHGGVAHLLGNLVMLLVGGSVIERALGWRSMLLVYAAGAYGAAGAQCFAAWILPGGEPLLPAVGASGAICALVGAYASLFGRERARPFGPIPASWAEATWHIATWSALNYGWALGMRGWGFEIAWPMHVGGFAVGLFLARPLLRRRPRGAKPVELVSDEAVSPDPDQDRSAR